MDTYVSAKDWTVGRSRHYGSLLIDYCARPDAELIDLDAFEVAAHTPQITVQQKAISVTVCMSRRRQRTPGGRQGYAYWTGEDVREGIRKSEMSWQCSWCERPLNSSVLVGGVCGVTIVIGDRKRFFGY